MAMWTGLMLNTDMVVACFDRNHPDHARLSGILEVVGPEGVFMIDTHLIEGLRDLHRRADEPGVDLDRACFQAGVWLSLDRVWPPWEECEEGVLIVGLKIMLASLVDLPYRVALRMALDGEVETGSDGGHEPALVEDEDRDEDVDDKPHWKH